MRPIHQEPEMFDEICESCPLPPKLIGKKVFLTAFSPEFAPEVLRMLTDETTAVGLGDYMYRAATMAQQEERLASWGCDFDDGYSMLVWDLSEMRPVGTCCLFDLHPVNRSAELSVAIGREHRRGGRATEALSLMLSYAFETLNLHSVRLEAFEYNVGAIECYRKLGFRDAGRLREAKWARGRFWDSLSMDILRGEWLAARS